jgi:hypothetical protein
MNLLCLVGLHTSQGCKCARCGKTRDEGHNWSGCRCLVCGKARDEGHNWSGCKCLNCGKTRDEGHSWSGYRCSNCGEIRNRAEIDSLIERLNAAYKCGDLQSFNEASAALHALGHPAGRFQHIDLGDGTYEVREWRK